MAEKNNVPADPETATLPVDVTDLRKQVAAANPAGVGEETVSMTSRQLLGAPHDGRFGEKFDDELSIQGIVWTVAGTLVVTALGFLAAWAVYKVSENLYGKAGDRIVDNTAARVTLSAVERAPDDEGKVVHETPKGPLLQVDPEVELKRMRAEDQAHMASYGWMDEGTGIVHVPIDKAIDIVVANGLPPAIPAPAAEDADVTEESP